MDASDKQEKQESLDLSNLSDRARADYALVRSAVEDGDQNAFAELLQQYREPLIQLLQKMTGNRDDAEDLMMESFARAFKNLKNYQPHYAFSTWLFRIATNAGIDHLRKKRLRTTSLDKTSTSAEGEEFSHDISSGQPDPEEHLISDQKREMLRKVVEQLKPRYRELILMRYYQEMSYEEIADKLNVPLGTVKAQLYRAKELLYHILVPRQNKF